MCVGAVFAKFAVCLQVRVWEPQSLDLRTFKLHGAHNALVKSHRFFLFIIQITFCSLESRTLFGHLLLVFILLLFEIEEPDDNVPKIIIDCFERGLIHVLIFRLSLTVSVFAHSLIFLLILDESEEPLLITMQLVELSLEFLLVEETVYLKLHFTNQI